MISVWKRYFLKEAIKVTLLVLGCVYFLFVLIDFSANSKVYQNVSISFLDILLYYVFQFAKQADILFSVALMLATIKVLSTSQMRLETVALTSGGIPLKAMLHPFLWIALGCSLLLYLNIQFLQPYALNKISAFERHYVKDRGKTHSGKPVNALFLEDNTLLLYQNYDHENKAFFDVFWLKNEDHFFRIKYLYPYEKTPLGKYVDSLMRTKEGTIIKLASHEESPFPEMHFSSDALFTAACPPSRQSMTQLARSLGGKSTLYGIKKMSDREAEIATYFYYKLSLPLVCLLAVIGPAPFCLRFTRNLPIFLIYALSLCSIITYFTLVNASVILAENQVMPPIIAIFVPQMLFSLALGWNYAKL